jgi:hypothetical protein
MATSFLAYVTSRLICPEPIYRELALNFLPAAPKPEPPKAESETEEAIEKTGA